MKVIALKRGYFGRRLIEAGEVFDAPDDARASWFTPHSPPMPSESAAPVRSRKKASAPVETLT